MQPGHRRAPTLVGMVSGKWPRPLRGPRPGWCENRVSRNVMKSCVPPLTRSLVLILPTEARVKLNAAESSVKGVEWPEPSDS
jgi:hypothetical protein